MTGNLKKSYVLITAAYNEERLIEQTILSVVSQTHLPKKWVIVSDGSTDRTDDIVRSYAQKYGLPELHRISEEHPRNFAAQVDAINTGYQLLRDLEFDFVGNLDADVSFAPDYFERLLQEFEKDVSLGIAGGYIHEECRGVFVSRQRNSTRSVAHAVQLFRRECFNMMGGYMPLPYGGPDWLAELVAQKNGWTVRSFPELPVRHYRPSSSAGGIVRGRFRQGQMDYSLGSVPVFEFIKCFTRIGTRPYIVGAFARFSGYLWSWCKRQQYVVPRSIVEHLRTEQRARVRSALKCATRRISRMVKGTIRQKQANSNQVIP